MQKKPIGTIHPFPLWHDLKRYSVPYLRADVMAALSVALMALPQAIAYAFVAELPISAGIYSAIFGAIFTAAFGSSPYLVSGTTNSIAILIQSGTSEILNSYYGGVTGTERDMLALQIVLQAVLIIGIFQIIGGLLKLGRLTQLASRSVVVGYVSGVAFAIGISQIFAFFGIAEDTNGDPVYQRAWHFLSHFQKLHLPTLFVGLGSLGVIVFFSRKRPKWPGAVIAFVLAAAFVAFIGLSPDGAIGRKITVLGDLGPINVGLPHIAFPIFNLKLIVKLVPLAFAITLLSTLEATTIGRIYAGSSYSDNQEVCGLGVSNIVVSFVGGMPSSGSFSRSALNFLSGAKTRFSAIFSGFWLFGIVLLLGVWVAKIPTASLSALLLFTAYSLINFKNIRICLKATRIDALVVLITFASSLLFSLDVALYVGVILSIILYLRQAAIPHLVEYTFNQQGKLRPMDTEDKRPDPRICIVHADGELFFGAADVFQVKLRQVAEQEGTRVVILQIINARRIDASVCMVLQQVHDYFDKIGCFLLISGVTPKVWSTMKNAGLIKALGKERIFAANEQVPSAPTRNAYAFAKSLLV